MNVEVVSCESVIALGRRPEPASFGRVVTDPRYGWEHHTEWRCSSPVRRDNGACDHVRRFAVDKMLDVAQRADMIVAGPNDTGDMVVKAQPAIQCHSENA